MRLLLDQGLAPQAAAILRQNQIDTVHVAEIGLDRADDIAILQHARADNRFCITLDHDFHAHLATTGSMNPSVVLLRVEGLNAKQQAKLIQSVCARCREALTEGAAVSADSEKIRVRRIAKPPSPESPPPTPHSPDSGKPRSLHKPPHNSAQSPTPAPRRPTPDSETSPRDKTE